MGKATIFVDAGYLIAVTRKKSKRVDLVKLSKALAEDSGGRRYFMMRCQSLEPAGIQTRKGFTAAYPNWTSVRYALEDCSMTGVAGQRKRGLT